MATTTPNFGWPVPTSTDLVKDGATAIEALGDGIDTSMVDLKGGTTGQILAKATSADMDFAWITNDVGDITAVTAGTGISGGGTSGAVTITNSMATEIAAKGDLIVGTGSQTFDNLTAGTNYRVLQAQSGQTTGLQWVGPVTQYTPTWTADGGSPSIGNGQLAGYWQRYGNFCHVKFFFQAGSTTNFGTGAWYFSLPFTSAAGNTTGMGGGHYTEDFAVAGYRGIVGLLSDNARFAWCNGVANTLIGATVPFTFGTNDYISGMFSYEVAA
jgi:hypothetical protein